MCKRQCNYNVINEQGLADKIKQAQDDVDSQQNTSAEKRAVVLIEGHNLLAIPWLVSLVDLAVWIKVPLRRCALSRVTRRAGFKGVTDPVLRESIVDKEMNEGFFSTHIGASGIEALEKKAHAVLTLEGPGGSPPWPDRDEAADHLQNIILDSLGREACDRVVERVAVPASPPRSAAASAIPAPTAEAGAGADCSGKSSAVPTAEAGAGTAGSSGGVAQASATTNRDRYTTAMSAKYKKGAGTGYTYEERAISSNREVQLPRR